MFCFPTGILYIKKELLQYALVSDSRMEFVQFGVKHPGEHYCRKQSVFKPAACCFQEGCEKGESNHLQRKGIVDLMYVVFISGMELYWYGVILEGRQHGI